MSERLDYLEGKFRRLCLPTSPWVKRLMDLERMDKERAYIGLRRTHASL